MPSVSPDDGPVAVTGASGYIGSHAVAALLKRGYTVHACLTDDRNAEKTAHLLALDSAGGPGKLRIFAADLFAAGSYDKPLADCCAVLHVGSPLGYAGRYQPRQVYDGAVAGTGNLLDSARKAGTVKRFVYTSSFAAIGHPAQSGYVFTEDDWASDGRQGDANWNEQNIDKNGGVAYAMAKVATEQQVNRAAEEDGRFDAVSVCPCVVLGPLLARTQEGVGSWQYAVARMLEGLPCPRGWQALWNIVDVRDVAEAHVLIAESGTVKPSSRYQLTATGRSGELDVWQLQAHLQNLFPNIHVGGAPMEMQEYLERRGGRVHDGPRAYCTKARTDLGLKTRSIEDTLHETGQTLIHLGLAEPSWK